MSYQASEGQQHEWEVGIANWQEKQAGYGDWQRLSEFNESIWHPLYECEIYCWLAIGAVILDRCRREEQYFLYCEYREQSGVSQYVVYSFSSLSEARDFQQRFVCKQVFPCISPEQTRRRPVPPK